MKVNWISAGAIISDHSEDSGIKAAGTHSSVMKKWTNDRIKEYLTAEQYTEQVALITIKDKVGLLPANWKSIIQAAYGFHKDNKSCTRTEVVKWAAKDAVSGCDITVSLDCPRCKKRECDCSEPIARFDVNPYDLAGHPEWTERYKQHFYDYGTIGGNECRTSRYNPSFLLMNPTLNNFFDASYHIKGCVNLRTDSAVEYAIEPPYIRLNITDCKVLLAYMGFNVDSKGWLMCPDLPEVWEGIKHYIDYKLAYKRYTASRDQNDFVFCMNLKRLSDEKLRDGSIKLGRPDLKKLKVMLDNLHGKMIPNYYNSDNLGREVPDAYMPYE